MYANPAVRVSAVPNPLVDETDLTPLPTPTSNLSLPLKAGEFDTIAEGLDYAAKGETGFNYYSVRGELRSALSYAELQDDAISLARKLLTLGLPRGARVALIAETIPDFHCIFFACQYASLVPVQLPVPMNLGAKEAYLDQLRHMIAAALPSVAVASAPMIEMLRAAIEGLDIPFVGTPEDFHALSEGPQLRLPGVEDPCYIQYSSGSTSEPKGIVVSQRSALSNVRGITQHGLRLRQDDRANSWLPLYHDMGLIGFCISPMMSQRSVDYLATADFARRPLLWLRLMSENGGTIAFSPTFGYDLCRRQGVNGSAAGLDLSSWRIAGIGGDMVRPSVLRRFTETFADKGFKGTAFLPSYGLAESTLAVSFAPLESEFEVDRIDKEALSRTGYAAPAAPNTPVEDTRSFVMCGSRLPHHEIEIWDPEGKKLPDRHVGRILVRGPSVMDGFFQAEEKTAEVLSEQGWLDTGDLGYMVEGSLVITGRSKDLIILNGRNIWPQDIEWAAERVAGVRHGDVAAFSVEGPENGEEVICLVQCRTSAPEAREELIHDVAMVVRKSVGVDCKVVLVPTRSLPLTSSGKISRSHAKARYLDGFYTRPRP
ncbi:MAG: fatty acyl-AMP ligase [Rhodospirillales bacterium]|nr:fatty acyl-AMP ligase [Rhodospirillales bacterium]